MSEQQIGILEKRKAELTRRAKLEARWGEDSNIFLDEIEALSSAIKALRVNLSAREIKQTFEAISEALEGLKVALGQVDRVRVDAELETARLELKKLRKMFRNLKDKES